MSEERELEPRWVLTEIRLVVVLFCIGRVGGLSTERTGESNDREAGERETMMCVTPFWRKSGFVDLLERDLSLFYSSDIWSSREWK